MGVSKQELLKILNGKARDLCSPQGDRMISEKQSPNKFDSNYNPNPDDYGDYEEFDRMYLNEDEENTSSDIHYSRKNAEYSNLREDIKESLLKNPIDRSSLANVSVLDSMNVPQRKQQRPRQIIDEKQQYQSYQQSQSNVIDYSLIKAIVNECISDYFERKQLNENTLKTIGLKEGKITLVDNKGNTYMAKLEKIGNVNNKRG